MVAARQRTWANSWRTLITRAIAQALGVAKRTAENERASPSWAGSLGGKPGSYSLTRSSALPKLSVAVAFSLACTSSGERLWLPREKNVQTAEDKQLQWNKILGGFQACCDHTCEKM